MIYAIPEGYYLVVTYILSGIIGLCVGSFLNVVIYRVPLAMSLATPASHCPKCGRKIKWYDNIPVISYIILGGKCRSCKEKISFRYTAVEILNALLWLLSVYVFHDNAVYAVIAMIVSSVSICVFFIDIEHMIIPDRFHFITLPFAILSIFCDTEYDYVSHLIGFGAAAIIFIGIALIGKAWLKKDALGGGDVKLLIVYGLLLGWQKLLLTVLIASISGSVFMIIKKIKEKESREIPFAPFLVAGLIISLFFGNVIIDFYTSLILNV